MIEPPQFQHGSFFQFENLPEPPLSHCFENQEFCWLSQEGLRFICEVMCGRQDDVDVDTTFRSVTVVFEFESVVVVLMVVPARRAAVV